MGNNNGKASVVVRDSKENKEKRQFVERSSGSPVHLKFGEWNASEDEKAIPMPLRPGSPTIITKSIEGEQVAAGWPAWLSDAAAEAIHGLVPRAIESYTILDKIGAGSYSTVFRARDLMQNRIVALKKVWFDNLDRKSVRFAAREILIMRRLGHPNVIKLEGVIALRRSTCLYLVLEYMQCDLAALASRPNIKLTEPQVKYYMHQLLCGLEYCHNQGVIHRDIKTSNLLVNNDGVLKIADFGLSKFSKFRRHFPLTNRVGTLWYRPPELLLGATRYGFGVDLWSTGCVLGELYAGRPIIQGGTEIEQLHKVFKLCGSPSEDLWRKLKIPNKDTFKPRVPYSRCVAETFKDDFAGVTLSLLETLLSLDPESRGTASLALENEFFGKKPFACDPSSLPKDPPNEATEYIRRRAPNRFIRKDANAEVAGLKQEFNGFVRVERAIGGELPSDVAQIHDEHDHQIRGAIQQATMLRAKKVQPQRMQTTANPAYSSPLHGPSIVVHDCHIQEAAQRIRVEKQKVGKVQAQEELLRVNKASSGPSLPSCNVDQLLEEHDRHIQESLRRAMLTKKKVVTSRPRDGNSR